MRRGAAPGKIILLGEHAVVYGHPALAAAISRSVRVSIEDAPQDSLTLPGGVRTPAEVLEGAVAIARDAGFSGHFAATVESEIPLGGGLGSSAALGVALARAFKPGCDAAEAARLAMHLETRLHGAPSGVDPAACAGHGLIRFTRGTPPTIEPVPAAPLFLVLAPTGIARGTKSTVMPLSERRKRDPETVDPVLRQIHALVDRAVEAIRAERLDALGACMNENHQLLRTLGVSCPELDALAQRLVQAGALGAKLTGAGGGGSAIALARDEAHAVTIAAQFPAAFVERVG